MMVDHKRWQPLQEDDNQRVEGDHSQLKLLVCNAKDRVTEITNRTTSSEVAVQ